MKFYYQLAYLLYYLSGEFKSYVNDYDVLRSIFDSYSDFLGLLNISPYSRLYVDKYEEISYDTKSAKKNNSEENDKYISNIYNNNDIKNNISNNNQPYNNTNTTNDNYINKNILNIDNNFKNNNINNSKNPTSKIIENSQLKKKYFAMLKQKSNRDPNNPPKRSFSVEYSFNGKIKRMYRNDCMIRKIYG